MKLESLRELFIEELEHLYSAERMITKALPKMAQTAGSPELKRAFEQHLQQTEGHLRRLDQIFDELEQSDKDVDREGKKCKGIEGILKEGAARIKEEAEPEARDARLIASAQRVEHYEVAAYGTARTYANILGRGNWARLLEETLNQETEANQLLNGIAGRVNLEAKAA